MNNISIIELIHNLTQLGFEVQFTEGLEGMLTVAIVDPYAGEEGYIHTHCGIPGGSIEHLEKDINNWLHKEYVNREDRVNTNYNE